MADNPYLVKPKKSIKLSDIRPDDTSSKWEIDEPTALAEMEKLKKDLHNLQRKLYAQQKHKILIVLQAMDTGGKDSTIRQVLHWVNPQGVRVPNFKKPTPRELAHDFLWRAHQHTPGNGEIVVFNRSHYEDVLIVRVHDLVEKSRWKKRYQHIKDFEQMLADEGTTILKFFLHISKAEQKQRLMSRAENPRKHWKLDPADLKERGFWDDYQRAYEDAINKTSTDCAPWYVIPSDHKWFRNYAVGRTIVETMKGLKLEYPEPKIDLTDFVIED